MSEAPAGAPFDLSGRTAVVTGGNSGIGFAAARALGASGAAVAVWGRNAQRNEEAADRLRAQGIQAAGFACGVSDEAQVEAALRRTIDELGPPTICVANAGVSPDRHDLSAHPTDVWRSVMGTNLDGAFFTLRAVARELVQRELPGSLIVVSSIVARFGMAGRPAYGAAKNALIGLTRAVAVEHARYGIRANAVLPGWTATPLLDGIAGEESEAEQRFREAIVRRVPMRRYAEPGEIAGVIVYLASDAAAYHTGDVLTVDGGYSVY